MPLRRTLVFGLMLGVFAGCTTTEQMAPHASWMNRMRALRPVFGSDALQLQVAVIRQPLGDPYLNFDLWQDIDEQVIPLEKRPALEANGLRVGTINGSVPDRLFTLLTSEKACVHSRQISVTPGKPHFLALGPGDRPRALQLVQDGETLAVTLDRAQFGLAIASSTNDDGRTVLKFEPRVQHGSSQFLPRPSAERGEWSLLPGRPEEKYPRLGWEVALTANEFVVIGALPQQKQTLGFYSLIQVEAEPTMQDILVIRPLPSRNATANPTPRGSVKPLAIQTLELFPWPLQRSQSP